MHIYVKVHLGGRVVHTGQLFFRDTLTDAVYKQSAYDGAEPRHAERRRLNLPQRRQSLAAEGDEDRLGYRAGITMGVHRG